MWKADDPRHMSPAGAILCAALCARALLPLIAYSLTRDAGIFKPPDAASYLACAESLARTGSFSISGVPEVVRTPGYPLLLVPGVALGHVTAVTVLLQAILGCATVWLVYRTTLILSENGLAAAASGLLCAFEPLSVLYCSLLLAETLFATLLMLFIFLVLVYLKRGKMRHFIAAACALAASAYVRPIAYWLPLVTAVVLAAACGRRERCIKGSLGALAFLCICAVLIGGWQIRNYLETGYRGFSGIGDQALYFYDAAAVESAVRGESYYAVQRRMGYHDGADAASRARRLERMAGEARRIILGHPGTFAVQYARGVARTMLDPAAIDYLKFFGRYREGSGLLGEIIDHGLACTVYELARSRPALFWSNLILGLLLLAYLLGALAAFTGGFLPGAPLAAVAVTAIYLILLSGGPNAHGRFRHPVMPLVCVLAGCGYERMRRRRDVIGRL